MDNATHIAALSSDKNSMDFWYTNLLKDPELREIVPGTIRIPLDYAAFFIDPAPHGVNEAALMAAAQAILDKRNVISGDGKRACFLRTDQYSNKHNWDESCYLPAGDLGLQAISQRIYAWLEECDGMFGPPPPKSAFVRHFLSLKTAFLAFDNMPVAREFRFFATPELVTHMQPYWPFDAIKQGWAKTPLPEDWEQQLAELGTIDKPTLDMLSAIATKAAAAQGGEEWSVDLCEDVDGKWWLTDMALGACSYRWHPEWTGDQPVVTVSANEDKADPAEYLVPDGG